MSVIRVSSSTYISIRSYFAFSAHEQERRTARERGKKKSAALAGVGGGSARVHHSSAVPASVCVCDRHITTETKTKRDEKQDGESGRRYLARGTRASYARVNGSGAWRKPREKKERKKLRALWSCRDSRRCSPPPCT